MVNTVFGAAHPRSGSGSQHRAGLWSKVRAMLSFYGSYTSYPLYPASFIWYYLLLIRLTYAYSVLSSSVLILSFKQLPA